MVSGKCGEKQTKNFKPIEEKIAKEFLDVVKQNITMLKNLQEILFCDATERLQQYHDLYQDVIQYIQAFQKKHKKCMQIPEYFLQNYQNVPKTRLRQQCEFMFFYAFQVMVNNIKFIVKDKFDEALAWKKIQKIPNRIITLQGIDSLGNLDFL